MNEHEVLTSLYGLHVAKIVVTSAGAGIGAETKRLVAGLGASVALLDAALDRAEAVAGEITATGAAAHALALDLEDEASVVSAFAAATKVLGGGFEIS